MLFPFPSVDLGEIEKHTNEGLFSFPIDIKFIYFPGKSLQVRNKGWFFELPKSNGKNLLTFNTFVMHRLTVFQEIQEEIFDCFSKISMFEKDVYTFFIHLNISWNLYL